MVEMKRAIELDPLSARMNYSLAGYFNFLRRYDESIRQCQKMRELDPNGLWTHEPLARAFHGKGMWAESWSEWKSYFLLMGNSEVAEAGDRGFAEAGYQGAWREVGWKWMEQSKQRYIAPLFLALSFTFAGEPNQALYWLERAFEERDPNLPYLKVWPEWDPLRSDPRFQDSVRRMNFPEQQR
jgi:hypothetical protein